MLEKPVYIDLEGADLTGKSTLLKTTFKHSDYSKILCFHDRGILTHYLYNATFKRYLDDLIIWLNELNNFVQSNGIVILHASDDLIKTRFGERSDDLFKLDNILKINKAYKEVYFDVLRPNKTVRFIEVDGKSPEQIMTEASDLYYYMLLKARNIL